MVSVPACPVTLTSLETNLRMTQTSLKTIETAQMRPQDAPKHVPTIADKLICLHNGYRL
jgi:hypothetical protein